MYNLDLVLTYIRDFIGIIGVLVICLGAARSLYQLAMFFIHGKFSENYIRLKFGETVILGLEFLVGADIVGSLVKPDYYTIGLLGIVVVIRSVLSYFLSLELKSLKSID